MTPESLAGKYGVRIHELLNDARNRAYSCGNDIYLGEFNDPEIRLCAFLHEVGHVKAPVWFCFLAKESAAWCWAFNEADDLGLGWSYHHKCAVYARECLASYIGGEYDDLKEFHRLTHERCISRPS